MSTTLKRREMFIGGRWVPGSGRDYQEIINPELFINMGPLSIQSEYLGSRVTGVTKYTTQLASNVATPSKNFLSQTAYIQAMYFLTGKQARATQRRGRGYLGLATRCTPSVS